jgi:hypothetical protein
MQGEQQGTLGRQRKSWLRHLHRFTAPSGCTAGGAQGYTHPGGEQWEEGSWLADPSSARA